MKSANVKLWDQPELFADTVHRALGAPPRPNEHGVYEEPDETLECGSLVTYGAKSSRGPRTHFQVFADIELLDLHDGTGWIGAYSYSFTGGGQSGPLTRTFGWNRDQSMAKGATRQECLDDCRAKLAAGVDGYVRSHGANQQTRKVAKWLAAGCPTEAGPSVLAGTDRTTSGAIGQP